MFRRFVTILALALGLGLLAIADLAPVCMANTMNLRGMNWSSADSSRDWPDGIIGVETPGQGYSVGQAAGNWAVGQGGSTLRLPLQPSLTAATNWGLYTNVINGVLATGCKVILCHWPTNYQVADTNQWYGIWDKANSIYGNATNVFYEPINEPANQANLNDLYAAFLARYNPQSNKCILDGAGYAQDVTSVGSDSRLSNQLLGLHVYQWYYSSSNSSTFYNSIASSVGSHASRTVITETGVPTDGNTVPSSSYWQQYGTNLNPYVAALNGALKWARDNEVGTIQWSGLNSHDFFRWARGLGNPTIPRLDVAQMFQWAWGEIGTPQNAKTLLTDSFYSSASSAELNGNATQRQTGLLAPVSWTPNNNWQAQLANPGPTNLLITGGISVYLNVDFAPFVNALNLPLAVSFLGSVANDGGDPTTWFSLNFNDSPSGWGPGNSKSYSILFRENGGSQIFNGLAGFPNNILGSPNWGSGATNRYVSVTAVLSDLSGLYSPFNGNGTKVTVFANGVPFTTNTLPAPLSNSYIGFTANGGSPPSYYIAGLQISTVGGAPQFSIPIQNVTNWAGLPVTLTATVVGSEPISFQWYSNNVALSGQTNFNLYLADPETTAPYFLQASNAFGQTNSPVITLFVKDPTESDQMLFSKKYIATTLVNTTPANNYIGEFFKTGANPPKVSHLGYYDASGGGTSAGHHVGIFKGNTLIASAYIPPGTSPFPAYGWRWMPLTNPITLLPNTTYSLFGDNNANDYWPNTFIPNWNSAYIGTNFTQNYLSWNWDAAPPFAFPDYPNSATIEGDQGWNQALAFGSVNAGYFPMTTGQITAVLSGTNLTLSWPADYTGWTLTTQTNKINLGLSLNPSDWMRLNNTVTTNQFVIPMNGATPAGFFRLVYP